MKHVKSIVSLLVALCVVATSLTCALFALADPDKSIEWVVRFEDEEGNEITNVANKGDTFWVSIGIKNYDGIIGEMNKVYDEDDNLDKTASSYDKTIAIGTVFLDYDSKLIANVKENGTPVYDTPYSAKSSMFQFAPNDDKKDDNTRQLRTIFYTDGANAGTIFSIGKSDLDANDGEIFRAKFKSKSDDFTTASVQIIDKEGATGTSVACTDKLAGASQASQYSLDFSDYDYTTKYSLTLGTAPSSEGPSNPSSEGPSNPSSEGPSNPSSEGPSNPSSNTSSVVETKTVQEKLDAGEIVKFDKFDNKNFIGDTDKIGTNGLLYANGKEVNTISLADKLNLGNQFQVTATFARTNKDHNATKNCLGEKYELVAGDVVLKVGNLQEGVAQNVAELYVKGQKIGYVQLGDDISGTYAIRYSRGDGTDIGKLYVVRNNETMTWNVVDSTLVSVDSANGVTTYFNVPVANAEFSNAEVSVTAAGNNSTDKSNYAYGLWLAKKFHSTTTTGSGSTGSNTGSTTSGNGGSGKTGDDSINILFIVIAFLVAGACIAFTAKKSRKAE